MKEFRIAVIPGDGIGPEVIREAVAVLRTAAVKDGRFSFLFTELPWGSGYYLENGCMMPEEAMDTLKAYDAILLGAVGDKRVPDHVSLGGLLLKLRKGFDEYVNLRPVKLLAGAPCPLKGVTPEDVDMVFVRENSEGEYAGTGAFLDEGTPLERAVQESVFTKKGCERVIRYAYRLAEKEGKTLTSISKGNALNYSMVYWDRVFKEVGREFPSVRTETLLVDAASMFMVKDPARFQIVVASNLFGDILTDLGAAIAGGMGLAAGANLNPERAFPSMFEPIHGSAPDIAGQGKADPLAAVWSAGQMLSFLGYPEWETKIVAAIETLLKEKKSLTPDLGGTATTEETGAALCALLNETA